jgi:hypothetical protein
MAQRIFIMDHQSRREEGLGFAIMPKVIRKNSKPRLTSIYTPEFLTD